MHPLQLLLVQVYGTHIMDITDLKVRADVLKATQESMDLAYALLPSSQLLVHPPFETAVNTSGYGLAAVHRTKWKDHFFKRVFTGGEVRIGEFEILPYNPLAITSSVVTMTWTYDTSVLFPPGVEDL